MAKGKKPQAARATTASGGPATFKGTNFQTDFAVLTSLRLMRESLSSGTKELTITPEPRLIGNDDTITACDIKLAPAQQCYEAKSNLSGADVLGWLRSVAATGPVNPDATFILVYGDGKPSLLAALDRLSRDAIAARDAPEFFKLTQAAAPEGAQKILDILKANPFETLRQIRLELLPRGAIEQLITVESESLAGPQKAKDLRNFLFERISKSAARRATLSISGLIDDAQDQHGIKLNLRPLAQLAAISEPEKAVLAALQPCVGGLPEEVLLASIQGARDVLQPLVQSGRIRVDAQRYELARPYFTYELAGMEVAIAKVLAALLAAIERAGRSRASGADVKSAVALANLCARSDPKLVSSVYPKLDKFLKDIGDKRLVLEAAELSIFAANRAPREAETKKNEAKTLICGRSWVLQRIGRLADAEVSGERSLRIGEDIPWPRNTAYCLKCLGRLLRLLAEATDGKERNRLLEKSVDYLKRAADSFDKLGEEDSNSEKGDSLSLLGRTYLASGKPDLCRRAVRAARKLVPDDGTKDDTLDLKILMGDVEREYGNASEDFYREAIETKVSGAEISEIRARAHFARAKTRVKLKNQDGAKADFARAYHIYEELDEPEFAALAKWEELLLDGSVPKNSMTELSKENYRVRVAAIQAFIDQESRSTADARDSGVIARRAAPPRDYWKRLVKEARKKIQILSVEW